MKNWGGKQVLVVGGSSGVGLHVARAFQSRGATVAIVGRDVERLAAAAKSLEDCLYLSCDMTDEEEVAQLFQTIAQTWQTIDVLVNAVGRSDRRLTLSCSVDDFDTLWRINFLTMVRSVRAGMSLIQPAGSIVNIASLAAKIASPNMGAYPVSKFAVAAYSQQLRYELRQKDSRVHVLLVCPGPVLRPEQTGVRYHASSGVPQHALRPGGGARLRGIDPDHLAKLIVRGCERRQIELIVPWRVRCLLAIQAISPRLGDWIVRKMTGGSKGN